MTDHSTSDTERFVEPIAAEEISGVSCRYDDCDDESDWLVEVEGGVGFVCCQECSVENRIYARENELYKTNVSEQARQSVNADTDQPEGNE
jgi:hypothetical protein